MITRFKIRLDCQKQTASRAEWAYYLYACLLEHVEKQYGDQLHLDAATPISHYLEIQDNSLIWNVSLFGQQTEEIFTDILTNQTSFYLNKEQIDLQIVGREVNTIQNVEELFTLSLTRKGKHCLEYMTTTAFKSQGHYINIPSMKLLLQSLMKKWNGYFPDTPIEDEDGEGMDAIVNGLRCSRYQLRNASYHLKGATIPGFTGNMTIENECNGFHRELADALLYFAEYSGIGIKTALGMGGIKCK